MRLAHQGDNILLFQGESVSPVLLGTFMGYEFHQCGLPYGSHTKQSGSAQSRGLQEYCVPFPNLQQQVATGLPNKGRPMGEAERGEREWR